VRAAGHRLLRGRSTGTDAPLVRADASRLPFRNAGFDAVTCGFALRNFVDLAAVLAECARMLRPQGGIALLDVGEPTSAPARAVHHLWFRRVVPIVGGLLSDRRAYTYLRRLTPISPHAELDMIGAVWLKRRASNARRAPPSSSRGCAGDPHPPQRAAAPSRAPSAPTTPTLTVLRGRHVARR
jgi:demethylmenaquinone methyltransferase/2-methoxy-6-polyprenyl-1,4-benzoquinol methylase